MRPNEGLVVERQGGRIKASFLAHLAGEIVLTERAFIDGTRLAGRHPQAVLLVENLGPYLDLRPPDNWLVAHVPGWNTATIRLLLEQFADTPIVHFGDLDPNGVRIAVHLRSCRPDIRWAVPDFWRELDTGVSFPIAFARARIIGEEIRLEVPLWGRFSDYLSYANQSGIGQGPITGGIVSRQ
jgi:hypothetical protein